jgi:uncharacterized membrane protein YhhN
MKNVWLPAFILVSLVNLAGVALGNNDLIFYTKPLLMPLLAMWLAMETFGRPPRFLKKMLFAGLAFATLGDILLMFGDQPLFFMLGLVAFLFTHLSYIGGFSSIRNLDNGFLRSNSSRILPYALFAAGLLWGLWDGIPEAMQLPVTVYALVITAMTLSVVNIKGSIPAATFRMILAGAILFMLSDSLIAANRFGGGIPSPGILIMATYIAGQFLIVKGVRDILKSV